MEQDKNMLFKNAMNYGLVLGAISVLHYFLGQTLNWQTSFFYRMILWVLAILVAFKGTKHLRDTFEGGYMSYGRALGSTFLIYLFSAFVFSMANYFIIKYMYPNFLEVFFTNMEQFYLETGTPEENVETIVTLLRKITTFGTYSVALFFGEIFHGFFYALILSFFLKKQKNIFED